MPRRIHFAIALLCSLLLQCGSQSQASDTIGWYFDEAATIRCTSGATYSPLTAYLCLKDVSSSSGVSGWQAMAVVTGNCLVNYDLRGDGLNLAVPPGFYVGLGTTNPIAPTQDMTIVLCTASIVPLDSSPIYLGVAGYSATPGDTLIAYSAGNDPGLIITATPASGSAIVPTAFVNATCWPCASNNRGPAYHVLAELLPESIDIVNPAGGDVFANVSISSTQLDSTLAAFAVEEVYKLTLAQPDTDSYLVRVTNDACTSTLFRDVFGFVLPDSSQRVPLLEGLRACPGVVWADTAAGQTLWTVANDPHQGWQIAGDYYGVDVDVRHAWDIVDGGDVRVGIIDTGVDARHPDFQGVSITGDQGTTYPGADYWHGTNVAGCLASAKNNEIDGRYYGTVGVAAVPLHVSRVDADQLTTTVVAQRLHDMLAVDVPIVNFSGGGPTGSLLLQNACSEWYNANRIMVAAAGNYTEDWPVTTPLAYPARYPSCVSVGAINRYGNKPWFAHYGDGQDFAAPGQEVTTTYTLYNIGTAEQDYTGLADGTSFAAPLVAGAAALLLAWNPRLYNDDVYQLLAMSCDNIHLLGPDDENTWKQYYGNGLIHAGAALDSLRANAMYEGRGSGCSSSSYEWMNGITVLNVPNLSSGVYNVRKYRCERSVQFPVTFLGPPHAWGRGVLTSGLTEQGATTIEWDRTRHCDVTDITASGCKLVSYVYRFYNQLGQEVMWYPCDTSSMQWGYAVLGRDGVVGIPETGSAMKALFAYPNPFNAEVELRVVSGASGKSQVEIVDVRGRLVRKLYSGWQDAGVTVVKWDGADDDGRVCASGVYFAVARTPDGTMTRRLALVK